MIWKRKHKYFMEKIIRGNTVATICWTDAQDHCLLFVGNELIDRFDSVKGAIDYYERENLQHLS